jgi:hypothetical protein
VFGADGVRAERGEAGDEPRRDRGVDQPVPVGGGTDGVDHQL